MDKDSKVFIADYARAVGISLARYLKNQGYTRVVISSGLELTEQLKVRELLLAESPDYVILAGGKSGGIRANEKYPADFIYNNLQIQNNVIHSAWEAKVKKLLFLASSCIYPKICPQPMKEDYLLTGPLEPTSEPYAIAKIAGIRMCQSYNLQYGTSYISAVPATLYGPGSHFDLETSHVLSALLPKLHEAKTRKEAKVVVWGTGSPRREFLHIDDLADACLFLMKSYSHSEIINVGYGEDLSIKELALLIKDIVGFKGDIVFDRSKPDGAPQKLLDSRKIRRLGWSPRVTLAEGMRQTYEWYQEHVGKELPR